MTQATQNKNIKVLFTFGGLPHYHNKVLSSLNEQEGIEVVVVAPQQQSATIGAGVEQSLDGISFRVIRLEEKKKWYGKVFFEGLLNTIKDEKPDIVVTIWPYILGFFFDIRFRSYLKKSNTKLLFKDIPFLLPKYKKALSYYSSEYFRSLNEDMVPVPNTFTYRMRMCFLNWCRKRYYGKLIDAHVNYIEGAEEILETYGVKKESVFVTYNSPDTDAIFDIKQQVQSLPVLLPPNPNRIIHVGRLVKWKRVDLLIDAFADINKHVFDAELIVVGKGPELANLKRQVQDLNLDGQVRFVGAIYKKEDLARYFSESAIYVLAGMGGLSINEAMAYGKPVVCSVCDGTEKHLVRDGYNGFFFEDGNAKDLSEKVRAILEDDNLKQKMGQRSEEIIRKEINVDAVIQGYEKAFNYLMK